MLIYKITMELEKRKTIQREQEMLAQYANFFILFLMRWKQIITTKKNVHKPVPKNVQEMHV